MHDDRISAKRKGVGKSDANGARLVQRHRLDRCRRMTLQRQDLVDTTWSDLKRQPDLGQELPSAGRLGREDELRSELHASRTRKSLCQEGTLQVSTGNQRAMTDPASVSGVGVSPSLISRQHDGQSCMHTLRRPAVAFSIQQVHELFLVRRHHSCTSQKRNTPESGLNHCISIY